MPLAPLAGLQISQPSLPPLPAPPSPFAPSTGRSLADQCPAGVSSGGGGGDGWSLREIQTQSSLVAGRSLLANGEEVKSGLFDWLLLTAFHLPRQQVITGGGGGQDTHRPPAPSSYPPLLSGLAFAEYPWLGRVSKEGDVWHLLRGRAICHILTADRDVTDLRLSDWLRGPEDPGRGKDGDMAEILLATDHYV